MKKPNLNLKLAERFSREPAGRYRSDGKHSGEVFRDDLLVPSLNEYDHITLDLDDTEGYGSSFLEEAFGGLVRVVRMTPSEFSERIKLICEEDQSIIDEINSYVLEEFNRSGGAVK